MRKSALRRKNYKNSSAHSLAVVKAGPVVVKADPVVVKADPVVVKAGPAVVKAGPVDGPVKVGLVAARKNVAVELTAKKCAQRF